MLTRRVKLQMIAFAVISVIGVLIVGLYYADLPKMLFGVGQYQVSVELPEAGGLYEGGNVTYRGTEIGRVVDVRLTTTGVVADLSLKSDVKVPSDLDAEVHSQTAVGEQYVALLPRSGKGPSLKNGDVIPRNRTSVPPNINNLLDATNKGLQAIPGGNLKTTIDEAYTAFGGLGPEFSRFINGATTLAADARKEQHALTNLIDNAGPVLNSQTNTSDAIQSWTYNVASITSQLKTQDQALRGVLEKGPAAADQARQLIDRLQPTLPIILMNLLNVGQVAVTYQNDIEQLLVLLPQGIANLQGTAMANLNQKQAFQGIYLSFDLNLNLPPACTTGFLPTQQQRAPSFEDTPERPAGDVYCRTPQDSQWNVRGARNTPCETRPGKRAATVALCESDEQYVPLNDGMSWKGDPNATLSGQDIPQLPPGSAPSAGVPPRAEAPPVPALATAQYDPMTGTYVAPDGNTYTQSNLAQTSGKEHTWQSMLTPPTTH